MLEVVSTGRPWSFDGGGDRFRLVSEAYCIRLANLFDPMLAVSTSLVEPLPHRIAADYGEMLPRHPLHFLLADDPGAGKTIMTGLLIKELMLRGDLSRCLIVCPREPGRTVAGRTPPPVRPALRNPDQRQAGVCAHGNRFQENPLAICRLDKLSRNEDVQAKLEQNDWDLVIRGEAHKMALPSSAARSWCRGSAAEGAVMRSQADLYDDRSVQVRPASRGDWQITSMPPRHVVLAYDAMPTIRYSAEEFDRIRWGVVPQALEEKWFIHADGDRLFFHRSWTGYCIYVADFERRGGG